MTQAITHGVWSELVTLHQKSKPAHLLAEVQQPLFPLMDTQLLTTSQFQVTLPEHSVRSHGTVLDTAHPRLTGFVLEQTVSITSTVQVRPMLDVTLVTITHTKPLLTSGLELL